MVSEEKKRKIIERKLNNQNIPYTVIAKEFNVSHIIVGNIVREYCEKNNIVKKYFPPSLLDIKFGSVREKNIVIDYVENKIDIIDLCEMYKINSKKLYIILDKYNIKKRSKCYRYVIDFPNEKTYLETLIDKIQDICLSIKKGLITAFGTVFPLR